MHVFHIWLAMWSDHLTNFIYSNSCSFLLSHLTVCNWLTNLCHIPGSHIPGRISFCKAPQLLHWSVISKKTDFNLFWFLLSHLTVCYWLTSLCHIPGSHIPGRVFFCKAPQLLHWSVISKKNYFNLFYFFALTFNSLLLTDQSVSHSRQPHSWQPHSWQSFLL